MTTSDEQEITARVVDRLRSAFDAVLVEGSASDIWSQGEVARFVDRVLDEGLVWEPEEDK